MKILKVSSIILSSIVLFSVLFSCGGSEVAKESNAITKIAPENVLVANYEIEGMVCAMGCAKTIQDEIKGMDGVAACNVDFKDGKAHIEFDKTQLTEKDIITKIEGMANGMYKVAPWTEKTPKENLESTTSGESDTKETVSEVSLSSLKIPNIFTLLLNQL
jgi:copper chaperone CopZ